MSSPAIKIAALNAAVGIAKQVDGVVTTEKTLATAKLFEFYLETGMSLATIPQGKEVTGAKSRLVETAKQLGGKVIEAGV